MIEVADIGAEPLSLIGTPRNPVRYPEQQLALLTPAALFDLTKNQFQSGDTALTRRLVSTLKVTRPA